MHKNSETGAAWSPYLGLRNASWSQNYASLIQLIATCMMMGGTCVYITPLSGSVRVTLLTGYYGKVERWNDEGSHQREHWCQCRTLLRPTNTGGVIFVAHVSTDGISFASTSWMRVEADNDAPRKGSLKGKDTWPICLIDTRFLVDPQIKYSNSLVIKCAVSSTFKTTHEIA